MTLNTITLLLTILFSALISGLYYGYSCSVNPGLARLDDLHYLSAMQSINREILNPMFFCSFFGTLILVVISTYQNYSVNAAKFYILLAAAVVYAIGSFGITIFGNVPLNESLDKLDLSVMTLDALKNVRLKFEIPWNNWHSIRTLASVISLILVTIAVFQTNEINE